MRHTTEDLAFAGRDISVEHATATGSARARTVLRRWGHYPHPTSERFCAPTPLIPMRGY
jgi:hypothetical protein